MRSHTGSVGRPLIDPPDPSQHARSPLAPSAVCPRGPPTAAPSDRFQLARRVQRPVQTRVPPSEQQPRGGRAEPRCNPPLAAFYRRLRERGKLPEVALVAVMCKLVALAGALLRANRLWQRRVGPYTPWVHGPVDELGRPAATIPARPARKHG